MVTNMNGTEIYYNAAVLLMDDEIRETLHKDLAPCTDQDFFSAYEKAHLKKYGEVWILSQADPTY